MSEDELGLLLQGKREFIISRFTRLSPLLIRNDNDKNTIVTSLS